MGHDNLHHKRKAKKEESFARKAAKRQANKTVLIVCEGTKTEPNFFRELVADFKIPGVLVDVVSSPSTCPKHLVDFAVVRNEDNEYDYVYCVFDKDSHKLYPEALQYIQKADDWLIAANSVPSFEYWLFLHFDFTTQPFFKKPNKSTGAQAVSLLKKHIPNYEKGSFGIYDLVKEKIDTACANAKRANMAAIKSKSDNPSTYVVDLVKFLMSLRDLDE